MTPNEELRRARVAMVNHKRKLARLENDLIAQRQKVRQQRENIKALAKKAGK